jgi:hypothetical protein
MRKSGAGQMAERLQVSARPHGCQCTDQQRSWPVCTLGSLSERLDDTNGHRGIRGHEGEQAQRGPGHDQEPGPAEHFTVEHAREVPPAHGGAKEDGLGAHTSLRASGLRSPTRTGPVCQCTVTVTPACQCKALARGHLYTGGPGGSDASGAAGVIRTEPACKAAGALGPHTGGRNGRIVGWRMWY